MFKASTLVVLLLALAACSSLPRRAYYDSPCSTDPGGHQCEIERYQNT